MSVEEEQQILRGERCQVCGGIPEDIDGNVIPAEGKPQTCPACQAIQEMNDKQRAGKEEAD